MRNACLQHFFHDSAQTFARKREDSHNILNKVLTVSIISRLKNIPNRLEVLFFFAIFAIEIKNNRWKEQKS